MRIVEYRVADEENETTVERFLRRRGISRRVLIELKKDTDGMTVDGKPVRTIDRLHAGDVLRLLLRENASSDTIPQADLPISIVYEDEDMWILDKPAGMAVHPSPQNRENTVANALAFRCAMQGEPFVFRAIGRLDKNTSGLLVVARNALSAGILTEWASQKKMRREYLAICRGEIPESGTIDAPIARVEGSVIQRQVRADGERAVTHFQRLAVRDGYSLTRVWLDTGRTHQIRVHMAHIGHPLPGDFLYCPEYDRIKRHALHAAFLTVPRPIGGEVLKFKSLLPDDMKSFFPERTME